MRIEIRTPLGIGLTAMGFVALSEGWSTAAGYGSLSLGLAILLMAGWRWLERDRDRLLRSSAELRERAFLRVDLPDMRRGQTDDVPIAVAYAMRGGGPPPSPLSTTRPTSSPPAGTAPRAPVPGRSAPSEVDQEPVVQSQPALLHVGVELRHE